MNADQFKVIYTGEIKDGFIINAVAEQFAMRFKITPDKALNILKAGKEVTLNKKAEHIKAFKLKSAFEEMGMQVRLERILLLVSNEDLEDQDKQQEEKQEVKKDTSDYAETNEKLSAASDSWSLDPLQTSEEKDEEENKNQLNAQDQDDTDQLEKVKKSDFNYTGLSNSPIINTSKNQRESKASSKLQQKTDENNEETEKQGFGKNLIDSVKGFFKN